MGAVDDHVAALATALQGPRAVRDDVLAEVRDGLHDAAAAHEATGLGRLAAERRAVAEFGAVAEVADGFQRELGAAQARRTALLVLSTLALQPLVWEHAWPAVAGVRSWAPGPTYLAVDAVVGWLGAAAGVGALLVAIACGSGARYLGGGGRMPRLAGVFAFGVVAVFAVAGLVLAVLSPPEAALATPLGAAWWAAFLVGPLAAIGLSGRRCLAASGRGGAGAAAALLER